MKKTLITLAVLASSIASVQATTVYDKDGTTLSVGGRAEVRGLFADSVEGSMQDKSRARINVAGETQISENLTGFGFVEYELTGSDSIKNRYIYAGIGTQAGDFSYGKQDTANVIVSDMTDIASYHSGQQQYIGSSSDKQDNVFLYSADLFDSLTVQANYIAQEEKDFDAYAISALFSMDFGLDLAASYSDQDEQNQVTLGAAYTLNDLYLGATYALGSVDKNDDF
ncbi:MAG: porin, partial [Psychromonas sp.]